MCKYKLLWLLDLFVFFTLVKAKESGVLSSEIEECNSAEFQCTDGDCIELKLRCDQNVDCFDGSDEIGCGRPVDDTTGDDSSQEFSSISGGSIGNETKDVVEETLHLLKEGDKQIELREDYRDIVIVAGLTGAGKSTITKFITNPNDLEAYDAGERILIRDRINNSISEVSTVVSKTIFPHMLIHHPSSTAFYDLPGFSDTRNATIEIANAFFMQKVAAHAERVKILLVVSHNTLRKAGTRTEFKTLIEHLIKFVKDIRKFSEGVVLIASKVENYRTSSDKIIHHIGEFLKSVNVDLNQIFQDPLQLRHARNFLRTLLEKNSTTGKYKRIGMFRQPAEVGPLMDDEDFSSNQVEAEDLILRRAQFVSTSPGDFGFSVSADSTLLTKTLAAKTKTKVGLVIEGLTKVIEKDVFEYPENSSDSSPWASLGNWTTGHSLLHQMTYELTGVGNRHRFFQVMNDTLSVFSIPSVNDLILGLFKLDTQLRFFDIINLENATAPQQWITPFSKLETKAAQKIRKMAEELNNRVMNITSAISTSLNQQTLSLMSAAITNETTANITGTEAPNNSASAQLDPQTLFENLTADSNAFNRMLCRISTTSTFAQFANKTLDLLENTHLKVLPSVFKSLRDISFDMNFNSGINSQRFPFKIDIWVQPIEVFAVFLQSQIQKLSSHFSEKTRLQNEARINEKLRSLEDVTNRVAAKADEESRRLALYYQQREESSNRSLTTLTANLANVRQEKERERESARIQLQQREASYNEDMNRLRQERQAERESATRQLIQRDASCNQAMVKLEQACKDVQESTTKQFQERERGLNLTLVKLREDHEKEREAFKNQFNELEQSFNGSLSEVRKQHEKERAAFKGELDLRELLCNETKAKLRQELLTEKEAAKRQLQELLSEFNLNLTKSRQDQEQKRQAFAKQLENSEKSFKASLAQVREEQEKERETTRSQLQQREESFNRSLTEMEHKRKAEHEATKNEFQERENALNETLTKLKEDHEQKRQAFAGQLEKNEQSFNRSVAELRKEQEQLREHERAAVTADLQWRESLFNQAKAKLEQDHKKERQALQKELDDLTKEKGNEQDRKRMHKELWECENGLENTLPAFAEHRTERDAVNKQLVEITKLAEMHYNEAQKQLPVCKSALNHM